MSTSEIPTVVESAVASPALLALLRAVVDLFGGADRVHAALDAEYAAGELAADIAEERKFGKSP